MEPDMRVDGLTVPIELSIDEATAKTCARLVELYANMHGCELIVRRHKDGRVTLEIAGGDR